MNKSPDATLIQDYLDELPLDQAQQQELERRLEEGGDLAELHHALLPPAVAAQEVDEETRELLESVPVRLSMGWPDAVERGCQLVQDHQGRPTIESTPELPNSARARARVPRWPAVACAPSTRQA